jgi:hypothetical protein
MLKEFSFQQKDDYIQYISDPTKHIVWYGGELQLIYLKWVETVLDKAQEEPKRTREQLVVAAEKINADFICCRATPSALEFKDQKSKMLFLLKYS